jgi:hypothetical protein
MGKTKVVHVDDKLASRKVKLQSLARRQVAGKPIRQWRDDRHAEISSDIQGSRRLRSDPSPRFGSNVVIAGAPRSSSGDSNLG